MAYLTHFEVEVYCIALDTASCLHWMRVVFLCLCYGSYGKGASQDMGFVQALLAACIVALFTKCQSLLPNISFGLMLMRLATCALSGFL